MMHGQTKIKFNVSYLVVSEQHVDICSFVL